jgi:flagellum-specific ATP synthase
MKGYPPSIFSWLQKVLERAGNSPRGSITALYTVLMEGDDISDPIVDIVRGIVDGHIFLSRKVAESNHYPAIDVLGSISRLMSAIASPEHKQAAAKMRTIMSMYRENKDLIDVGMYQPGSNPRLDTAIEMMPKVNAFLQQRTSDSVTMEGTISQLVEMMEGIDI